MAQHYEQLSNFSSPVVWVKCHKGQLLPKGLSPVFGGLSVENGEPTYVARVLHQGHIIPGRLVPSTSTCYVGLDLTEHAYTESYQVLTKPDGTRLEWVNDQNGHVPDGAVVGGQLANGTKLYIGRVHHDGFGVCGKVHHKALYIAVDGKEYLIKKYQVLSLFDPLKWIDCEDGQVPLSLLNPVMSGVTADGEPSYVARTRHETRHQGGRHSSAASLCGSGPRNVITRSSGYGYSRSSSGSSRSSYSEIVQSNLIPGRLVPSEKKCYVGHGLKEHSYSRYQVLTNPFKVQLEWMPARDGHVPDGALLGGQSDGLKLYIGRVYHDGFSICGGISRESKALWIAIGGTELRLYKYEVLVDIEKMANTNQQLINHGMTM